MKKILRFIAGVTAIALILILLLITNSFLGNPISKSIATNSAKEYIENTYPNLDVEIDRVGYNFKFGGYSAFIKSESSVDTHFNVDVSMTGKILRDDYEDYVTNGFNTWQRIETDYRDLADIILESDDFPYALDFGFGSIPTDGSDWGEGQDYGIDMSELVLDKEYDIKEIAKEDGALTIYVYDDEITKERFCDMLLGIRAIFDEKDIPFSYITLVLQETKTEENIRDRAEIRVDMLDYDEIYEDGIIERFDYFPTIANEPKW